MELNYQNSTSYCILFVCLSVLDLNGSKLYDTVQKSRARSWNTSVFLKNEEHIPVKNLVTSIS